MIGSRASRFSGFHIVHNSKECIGTIHNANDPFIESIHTLQHFESTDAIGYLMISFRRKTMF